MIGLSGLRIKHGHFYGSGYKSHIQCSVPGRVARVQSLAEELQMLWCDQKKKKKGIPYFYTFQPTMLNSVF